MARKKLQLKVKFEQVLLFSDGPQIVLMSAAGSKIVGVAVNIDGMEMPFYAAQISTEQFREYLTEKFDLRYLLVKPDMRRNIIFDLAAVEDGWVPVERVKISSEEVEPYLPDHGLFARDHTESLAVDLGMPTGQQTYGIDGKWDVPEVSRFYAQVTDLYSVFTSVDAFLDQQTSLDQKLRVQKAFAKPFQGGGSYVSLYDSLAIATPRAEQLHLDGMAYNSPGYVRVRGQPKALSDVRQLLEHIGRNSEVIAESYRSLHKFLSENKLLKMHASKFNSSHDLNAEVTLRARELSDLIDAVAFNDVYKLSERNSLVAAKVILSIYRRATRLYEFFLQGRASFDVATSLA